MDKGKLVFLKRASHVFLVEEQFGEGGPPNNIGNLLCVTRYTKLAGIKIELIVT